MANHCLGCGVIEGQFHVFGCVSEICLFCNELSAYCDCMYEHFNLVDESLYPDYPHIPLELLENGFPREMIDEWELHMMQSGRYPFILYPDICCRCGEVNPKPWKKKVSKEEWQTYVELEYQTRAMCEECFEVIKELTNSFYEYPEEPPKEQLKEPPAKVKTFKRAVVKLND